MESDRKIPALKLFVSQLDRARHKPVDAADVLLGVDTNLVGLVLLGVEFTRVWLQVYNTSSGGDHYASARALGLHHGHRTVVHSVLEACVL